MVGSFVFGTWFLYMGITERIQLQFGTKQRKEVNMSGSTTRVNPSTPRRIKRRKCNHPPSPPATPELVSSNNNTAPHPEHVNSTSTPQPEEANSNSGPHPNQVNSNSTAHPEEVNSNTGPHPEQVNSNSGSEVVDPEIKAELTRTERAKERKQLYGKYGDRKLLHRHDKMGIARLGGNLQSTYIFPRLDHPNLNDPDYPTPKSILNGMSDVKDDGYRRNLHGYGAYNQTWQPNGPMYAGQPTAAVDGVDDFFMKTGEPFAMFLKRSRTKLTSKTEGNLLGWEYVGNYRVMKDDDDGEIPEFWESAANFSEASKAMISKKVLQSAQSQDGYGRQRLDAWRKLLMEELEKDLSPAAPQYMVEGREHTPDEIREPRPSLAARARALRFVPSMSDEKLSWLLVHLDEYHSQVMLQFVEYDERVYEYCVGGPTSKNKDGKQRKGSEEPAKAQDWYDFAEMNMLFKF